MPRTEKEKNWRLTFRSNSSDYSHLSSAIMSPRGMCINSFNPHSRPQGRHSYPHVQMRHLSLREVEGRACDPTERRWQG